jgi:alkylation response protein AidB-like acyl-CoA dehydrogenase
MLDYMDMDATLSEEERLVRETAREFVADRVREDIADHWLEGTLPEEIIPAMGELDFFAPNLEWGDLPGVSERAYGLLLRELEACDSGIRSMASVQGALVMYPIAEYGSRAQKEEWLPALAAGDAVGCFGLTEPAHGSNPAGMETSARPEDEGYVLDGTKTWITNAPIADLAVVWARERADGTVRGFLVETDREGVTTTDIDGKLSLRASVTGELDLDGVYVPEGNVLPDVEGMKGPLSCLTQARYGIVWGAVGAATDCFETARGYADEREQFGQPIAGFQLQQAKLAEMATQITLADLLAHRLADLKERGELRPQQVSMAKRNNVRMARDQSRIAREILGGNGITADHSPMRHMANFETVYTYEGTHDIHTLILGEDLTGIAAFT